MLKVLHSLSQEGHRPSNAPPVKPGCDGKNGSLLPRPRISNSKPCPPNSSSTPSIPNGSKALIPGRKKIDADDNKPSIRASPVPRPRAVLSSPDNDDMIGHQNQLSRERERAPSVRPLIERGAAAAAGQLKPTTKNVRLHNCSNSTRTAPSLDQEKPTVKNGPGFKRAPLERAVKAHIQAQSILLASGP